MTLRPRGFAPLKSYLPRRRDLVLTDFDPSAGRETPGRHAALVISPAAVNRDHLMLVCHVSSTAFDGFTVFIPPGRKLGVDGYIHYRQVRAIDWKARGAAFLCRCPDDLFAEVIARLMAMIDPDLAGGED